jgi:hypothetical protein
MNTSQIRFFDHFGFDKYKERDDRRKALLIRLTIK